MCLATAKSGLDKLYGQPALSASPLTTKSAPSARSFLPVPLASGQTQSAQSLPPGGQQSTRVHYQCLILQAVYGNEQHLIFHNPFVSTKNAQLPYNL